MRGERDHTVRGTLHPRSVSRTVIAGDDGATAAGPGGGSAARAARRKTATAASADAAPRRTGKPGET
jgi:hypothetical protein